MGICRAYIMLFIIAGFILSACNAGANTVASTPSLVPSTKTPLPPTASDTVVPPTATLTSTNTPTPSVTPTPTATAVDPILAETGYDVASFRLSYPREDIMKVDFQYRLKDGLNEAFITIQLPADCRDGRWTYPWQFPYAAVTRPTGAVSITYKLPIEGECTYDEFYVNILPIIKDGSTSLIQEIDYQEKVFLPYSIVRNFPTINTNVVRFWNFRFEQTGAWKGNILIDYDISEKIPLELEEYFFSIRGTGGAGSCSFRAQGEIIKEYSGTYVIPVNLTDLDCIQGYTSYLFDSFFFYVVDESTDDSLIFHTPVLKTQFVD